MSDTYYFSDPADPVLPPGYTLWKEERDGLWRAKIDINLGGKATTAVSGRSVIQPTNDITRAIQETWKHFIFFLIKDNVVNEITSRAGQGGIDTKK